MGVCSIDASCTIWDVEKECVKTQLIAHEKEVYDIAFAQGMFTFATAGGDGSVRHFDVRELEHSAILYESPEQTPFLRLAWDHISPNYLATFMMDSNKVTIIDIRYPMQPFAELTGHIDSVNCLTWSPSSRYPLLYPNSDLVASTYVQQGTTHRCSSGI